LKPAADDLVTIGRVVGTFGVKGMLKIATSDPSLLEAGRRLFVCRAGAQPRALAVEQSREYGRGWLVKLETIDDANAAEELRSAALMLPKSDLPELPAHTYRDDDLIGLTVVDDELGALGSVTHVRHYPQCDMLVVGINGMLVPLLRVYRVRVDLKAGTIRTHLPPGFEELR